MTPPAVTPPAMAVRDLTVTFQTRRGPVTALSGIDLDPDRIQASYPHHLSGGMAQRVVTGVAVLVITHDLELAQRLGGRTSVLYASYLIEHRPTAALFDTPAHPYVAALLDARPQCGGRPIPGLVRTQRASRLLPLRRPLHRGTRTVPGRDPRAHRPGRRRGSLRPAQRHSHSRRYPDGGPRCWWRPLLDGVQLEVCPGERVALCGPSGSGESTLARILALLEAPNSGHVILDGDPIHHAGLRLRRETRQRGERYPHEVSEGQLQRACLARALIHPPRYLICDEPTSMLDVSTQAALLAVIADEQRHRDLGVLLITHDRTLATHWCGRLIELATTSRCQFDHCAPQVRLVEGLLHAAGEEPLP